MEEREGNVLMENIKQIAELKERLIRLTEERIREFQDLTWESQPTSYRIEGKSHYLYNGGAVRRRRHRNRSENLPDGYGKLMWITHDCQVWDRTDSIDVTTNPIAMEKLPPLDVADLTRRVLKTIRDALKAEVSYFIMSHNELLKAIEEVERFSLKDLLERSFSEVVIEAIEGK